MNTKDNLDLLMQEFIRSETPPISLLNEIEHNIGVLWHEMQYSKEEQEERRR